MMLLSGPVVWAALVANGWPLQLLVEVLLTRGLAASAALAASLERERGEGDGVAG